MKCNPIEFRNLPGGNCISNYVNGAKTKKILTN